MGRNGISMSAQRIPEQIQAPAGEQLILEVHATGDQVYVCKSEGGQCGWT